MKLKIKSRVDLKGVPSASGIEYFDNSFYIVGDNSAWLYVFDEAFKKSSAYKIYDYPDTSGDTIPKTVKPDFEATTIRAGQNQSTLFVFGSGSKKEFRNVLIQIDLYDPLKFRLTSLERFYDALKAKGINEINIEGAVYAQHSFFLFNRAGNQVVQFSDSDFMKFLEEPDAIPDFVVYKFNLPMKNNVQAGFSGACLIPGTNQVVFTASLEQTENWIDDGEILGSYIGLINLSQMTELNEIPLTPVIQNGKMLPIKIESVTVRDVRKTSVNLFLVSDSDGGISELIEAQLLIDR